MAAILLDGLTIDLTDSMDFYNTHNDSASVESMVGDGCAITIKVGHDTVKIHAHFSTLIDMMDAIALHAGYKPVIIVGEDNKKDAECCDEYFDEDGNYHVNKPAVKPKPKARPVSRKTYIKQAGMLDFNENKDTKSE